MARAQELEPIISEIRDLLRSNKESDVELGLRDWSVRSNDFEVFLDILEGVLTTPLKKIYEEKLRKNDDWWHENFKENLDGFRNLFLSFQHKSLILPWVLGKLQDFNAISAQDIELVINPSSMEAEIERLIEKTKKPRDTIQAGITYDSNLHWSGHKGIWSQEVQKAVDEITAILDEMNTFPSSTRKLFDYDYFHVCRSLMRVGYEHVASYVCKVTKEDRKPGLSSMAEHRAGLLADIVLDKRGIFIFEEALIDEIVPELIKDGTNSTADIGALIADKNPKKALQLFLGVLERINRGTYYGISNQADVFCLMAYHTAESILPELPEKGNALLKTVCKKSNQLFDFTVSSERSSTTRAQIDASIKVCTLLARICVLFQNTVEMDAQKVISPLIRRILGSEQSQKEYALKELSKSSIQNKMGLIFHKFEEEEKTKLHLCISADQWIHLFSEGQSEEDQQEMIRVVQS